MTGSPASMYAELSPSAVNGVPGVTALVNAIPELRMGKWKLRTYQVTEIRKQRRKRIVFGVIRYREGTRAAARHVVTKVYGSDRGSRALAVLGQLWALGFHTPSSSRVPQPFGYEHEVGALYQGHVRGMQWADLLRSDRLELERSSRRAAAWLTRLQITRVRADSEPVTVSARQVRAAVRELSAAFPNHRRSLGSLGRRIQRDLTSEDVPRVASHGDYHPKNVFIAARHVTVIDFDTFALREASHDIGYAIAQLLIMSFFRTGSFAAGATAAAAFQAACDGADALRWRRERVHIARSLMQSLRYELCTLHNRRLRLLKLWPQVAQLVLDSSDPAAFFRGLR